MALSVTASVNAGISLHWGEHRVWCDALHDTQVPGLSTVTPERFQHLLSHPAFQDPELLFFTHCHPDHYSKSQTRLVQQRWPGAFLALPERQEPVQIQLQGEQFHLRLGEDLSIRFRRLPHEGKQYAAVPHYGALLEREGFRVLLAGDCAIGAPELADFAAGTAVDLAVLPFPWVTLPKGRAFVEKVIRPRRLLVHHLPLPEDDLYGYRPATEAALSKVQVPEVRLMDRAFQEIVVD